MIGALATGGRSHAFQVKKSARGTPLRWAEGEVDVDISVAGAPQGLDPRLTARAVALAYETWAAAIPAEVSFSYHFVDGEPPSPDKHDRRNLVRWVTEGWDQRYEPGALAVALTTHDPDTGRITDADIVLNAAAFRWTIVDESCDRAYDLQNVLTHEIGHAIGLAHEPDRRPATMFPSSPHCETQKRDLDTDDIAALEYLYGELGPAGVEAFGCAAGPGRGRTVGGLFAVAVVVAAQVGVSRRRGRRRDGRDHGLPGQLSLDAAEDRDTAQV